MKHIVQLSGGKDSTAMLLMMLERNMPVDEIIFCDTGMEFPAMYDHLQHVEQYTGRKITRLKADKPFLYYFAEHVKEKGKGKCQCGYGWPRMWVRWCTRLLKQQPTTQYLKAACDYIQYIGIAADEPKRHANITKNTVHPLFNWGVTEKQALEYCYSKGFDWGGLYEKFGRVSCWCCPLQRISELRTLYHCYPELWQRLKDMDAMTTYKFKPDYSINQLERRFVLEDAQGCLFEVDEVVKMTEPVSRCCKNCETRSVNCHATCEKYLAYRKMRNEINAARQKEKIKDTLEMQRLQKAKDVMLAKKQRGMR